MLESVQAQRRIGRYAWVMAWFGLVAGQLHALARHNTVDGRGDLKLPLTRLWSDPARSTLKPLLDWANPDAVYLTYGKIWLPVFLGFTMCAFVVRRRRRPAGFEKWAWRVALTGYVWATFAVFCDYWTQLDTYNVLFGPAFALTIPGIVVTVIGSTLLGIALLRNDFRPKSSAWLLALIIPFAVGIVQFTSLGSFALPVMFAFAILGRRIANEGATDAVTASARVSPARS